MVRLTEEMVVARTRMSDFANVKKLNCWGTELTDVSILRKMQNVEVLSLSVNNINTLADFQYCMNLQDLFIRKNNITDLNEVCYLQNLSNLRNLWLGENPCAEREGYRLAVLRALPNLEKLDDKIVSAEEVQTALARGRILVHPLDMDASPPQSDPISPEDVVPEYIEETDTDRQRRYSSSSDQRSYEEPQHAPEEYQDNDRRNANYNTSPPHRYAQSQYPYELQNGRSGTKSQNKDEAPSVESRGIGETTAARVIEVAKDYEERPAAPRHNGDYEERRAYSDYGNNDSGQRSYVTASPRTQYPAEYPEERRIERASYDYDDRRPPDYEEPQPPMQARRSASQQNIDRDESSQLQGWVRQTDKDKCRFHYQRRPVTRNSNILSAVLCLVKELDYPSLEVVEMAVRNRMDELEE
ncbi:protein tilB homolog isoform X2 [Orussus abietinus]|uniref:protein tilB homolog isoform X2 n=1 Tax=Orussus abietinus TaxID=222816 RepID=UPI0006267423|nr:protein tilB homolog isoform X2 [Orussus abietinus]